MTRLLKLLQKAVDIAVEGPNLMTRVHDLTETFEAEIATYRDSSIIDLVRTDFSNLTEVLNYLHDEEKANASEKELPLVEKQIKDLEERVSKLQALASSLQSIRQIAIVYEKEASITQLNDSKMTSILITIRFKVILTSVVLGLISKKKIR